MNMHVVDYNIAQNIFVLINIQVQVKLYMEIRRIEINRKQYNYFAEKIYNPPQC